MSVRSDSGNTNLEEIVPSHIEELADVVIVLARDKSQFEITVVDSDGIRVELVVLFSDKLKPGTDLQLLKCFAAFPITKSSNVEVGEVNLFHHFVLILCHNSNRLLVF